MESKISFYSKIFSKLQKTAMYNSIRGVFSVSMRPGITFGLAITVVSIVYFFGFVNAYAEPHNEGHPANILSNGSFDEGIYSPTESPIDWAWDAWQPSAIPTWDDTQAQTGDKSVKIYAPTPNDARWIQTVDVDPNKLYFLSGWIKTDNVGHTLESVDAGANLSLYGTWTHSVGVFGTRGWTRNGILFNPGSDTEVTVGARLGYWAGTTTGTAWFDDLQLKPIVPMDPHPSWKILVLIYQETDFEVTDDTGTYHHYVASMTQDEMEQAASAAKHFAEIDIPALTSGNMVPQLTVRFPEREMSELSPVGSGWWPSPEDTAPERDSEFDSVIVIWDPRATDLTTNKYKWIGYGDGLAANMGTGQTYFSMQIDAAVYRGHRNVFKHEWGHCILFYFDAVGTAPKPTVSNHAEATDYVNCQTGQFYVWQDETLANPIPNSIYNNESGFTHDYYSGTTATADHPSRCLGITPEAWTLGGPVSHSGNINQPPEAICQDMTVPTESGLCTADASVDDGSNDPKGGDPITLEQVPPGPYDLGSTNVTLTVTDSLGLSDSCTGTVTVVDTEDPDIVCNAPPTITPPDAPISFTASATDNCSVASVEITEFDCFKFTKKGKRIDKTDSCVVEVAGATVTIMDSGGVDDHITWTVRATDNCGNVAEYVCEVIVVNPKFETDADIVTSNSASSGGSGGKCFITTAKHSSHSAMDRDKN